MPTVNKWPIAYQQHPTPRAQNERREASDNELHGKRMNEFCLEYISWGEL